MVDRTYNKIPNYSILTEDERATTLLKEKLVCGSFMRAFSESMDKLENTLWQMLTQRSLSKAKGVNLDYIGSIVGVKRIPPSQNDEDYLTKILTEINVRRSDSTPNTVLRVMKIVHNSIVAGNIFEHISPNAGGLVVKIVTGRDVPNAVRLMKQVSPAGIGSVAILKDKTPLSNCWTPAEVGGGVDHIITDLSDGIVTDTAKAIVALQGGGIVQDDGKGSSFLADQFVTQSLFAVQTPLTIRDEDNLLMDSENSDPPYDKNTVLAVQERGIDNTVGVFAEVQQLRYSSKVVEGK